MGAGLLFLYVIYQTVITSSLGGVTPPFSDLVGKVTPVKPKPLPPSTFSSSSLIWDGEDNILPTILSSSSEGSVSRKFSAPLKLSSSSRPVTPPKLDTSSISDVKLQERLRKELLPPKVRSLPLIPKLCSDPIVEDVAKINLPLRYPSVSSPSKLPHALPYYSKSNEVNKPLRRSSIEYFDAASPPLSLLKPRTSSPSVTSTLEPPTLSAAKSLSSNPSSAIKNINSNNLYPLTSLYSLPYPLHYKSMYLPRVRTPADMVTFNYEPLSYAGANLNAINQSNSKNIIIPPFISPTKVSSVSSYFHPMKTAEFPSIFNTITIPKMPKSKPLSIDSGFSTLNEQFINPGREPLEADSCTASFAFESKVVSPFGIPELIPTMPVKIKNSNSHVQNLQPCIDSDYVPKQKQINVLEKLTTPLISETSSYFPCLPQQCIANVPKISPPPLEPVTKILSDISSSSPIAYCPATVSQTPATSLSHVNLSPLFISQATSKLVSSIDSIVSNLAQKIVSSYKPYLNSIYTTISNPYVINEFKPKQVCSVGNPLPPVNILNTEASLPVTYSPCNCINTSPVVSSPAVVTFDAPMTTASSICECRSNYLSPISSPQPIITTVLPPTSLISYASPQPCPSYLPSPTLPSYPHIYPPVLMEMPVIKVCAKDKDEKNIEELMLLAEILNEDESFDWNDLDTLLTLLSVS